jgi:hypothetical protein
VKRLAPPSLALLLPLAVATCGPAVVPIPPASVPSAVVSSSAAPVAPGLVEPGPSTPEWTPVVHEVAAAPMSLTAADGTLLRLATVTARTVVEGPLAMTELRLAFDNPADRVIEGRFDLALPRGASLSRFAMKIDDRWQEGEIVEKKRARDVYEDFLLGTVDPALLEEGAGNAFHARVYPVPAKGRKELIVGYAQVLGSATTTLVPLQGLGALDALDVTVASLSGGRPVQSLIRRSYRPEGDFGLDPRLRRAIDGVRNGDLVMARVTVPGVARPDPLGSLLVLLDTSASRALDLEAQLRVLGTLVETVKARAGADATVVVAAFDQSVDEVFAGKAGSFGETQLGSLRQRRALGASNLGEALTWARARAKKAGVERVVVIGDGIATAGTTDPSALATTVASLAGAGVRRLDAIAVGGLRDEPLLGRLAAAGLPTMGVVVDGGQAWPEIERRLSHAPLAPVRVQIPGATWSHPTELRSVLPGDEAHVFASLDPAATMTVSLDGVASPPLALEGASRSFLERAWAQARIDSLLERVGATPSLVDEIVRLSVVHRIMTPYTSMLVLETDADYRAFGLGRNGAPSAPPPDGAFRRSAPRPRPPVVRMGMTSVSGTMIPAPVHRVVAANLGRVRLCYEDALQRDRRTAGRMLVWLRIARDGSVGRLSVDPMSIGDRRLVDCVTRAFQGLGFSQPEGGTVDVTIPLELSVAHGVTLFGWPSLVHPPDAPPPPSKPEPLVPDPADAYDGDFGAVMASLAKRDAPGALAKAREWQARAPGDLLALLGLGQAYEASATPHAAERAYGSILDLFPSRADLRRHAATRLEHVAGGHGRSLAIDAYREARKQRPDHPSSHHLLAMAMLAAGDHEQAFATLRDAAGLPFPAARFPGAARVLREEAAIVAAAWSAHDRRKRAVIDRDLAALGIAMPTEPSLHVVLTWESDVSNLDLYVFDNVLSAIRYGETKLPDGGELYADVDDGFGPECFSVHGRPRRPTRYTLQVKRGSSGPGGYGLGRVHVLHHDGAGGVRVEVRPFEITKADGLADLGDVGR